MNCAECEPLLSACLDGELDAATALRVERHISECDACAGQYRKLEGLREEIAAAELDWSAGVDLRPLRAAIRRRIFPSSRIAAWWKPSLLAVAAAAFLVLVFPGRFPSKNGGIERQVVDNHVRSLMAEHLIDVASSDRHTVKPWFQGRLGFSPVVHDLTPEGFTLVGGRLDVIEGRPTAAIVYTRQKHVINLWMASADPGEQKPQQTSLDGYHVIRWQRDGTICWAVSDLNVAELRQFADLIRSR